MDIWQVEMFSAIKCISGPITFCVLIVNFCSSIVFIQRAKLPSLIRVCFGFAWPSTLFVWSGISFWRIVVCCDILYDLILLMQDVLNQVFKCIKMVWKFACQHLDCVQVVLILCQDLTFHLVFIFFKCHLKCLPHFLYILGG